jgi:hypothetical protein
MSLHWIGRCRLLGDDLDVLGAGGADDREPD